MEEVRNAQKTEVGSLGVIGRAILKWILEKYDVD